MKQFLTGVCLLAMPFFARCQDVITAVPCEWLGLVMNVSDTNMISIYHPGSYLIHPTDFNVMVWEILDAQGNVIVEDTLVGQSGITFSHDVALTDSMMVSVQLINDSANFNGDGVNCLIDEVLVWEETEWPNGTVQGAWTFNGNIGVDQSDVTAMDCSLYEVSANSSDTGAVYFNHLGSFFTSPMSENVLIWEFSNAMGDVLLQDTVVGEEGYLYEHDVPLDDTISYSVIHINDSAMLDGMSVNCLVEGQLVWHEFDFGGTVWGGWTAILAGCSDADACNFNPSATDDDGSCHWGPTPDFNVIDAACFGYAGIITLDAENQDLEGVTVTAGNVDLLIANYVVPSAGIWQVTATDSLGCSNVIDLEVSEPDSLVLELTLLSDDSGTGNGQAVANVSGGTPPYEVIWVDEESSNTCNPDSLAAGDYVVTVVDANGCSVTGTLAMSVDVINEVEVLGGVVFPVPVQGEFTYRLNRPLSSKAQLEVFDSRGTRVSSVTLIAGQQSCVTSAQGWASGMYTIRLVSENGFTVERLIKR